jgi:TolB-like protein
MDTRTATRRAAHAALAVLLVLGAGCTAGGRARPDADVTAGPRPRVAIVPFENLTLREDASDVLTRVLFVELVRTGTSEVVESGEVEAVLESLRVRPTGSLATEQIRAIGARLRVGYLMVGSVLESDVTRTSEGDVPSVGVALKLLEVASGRVVWANLVVRTGDDREKVFGWGRELDRNRLASALARDILRDFRIPVAAAVPSAAPAHPDSLSTGAPR